MACACKGGKTAKPSPWVVRLVSGDVKSYASEQAAKAKHEANPGSILVPPAPPA